MLAIETKYEEVWKKIFERIEAQCLQAWVPDIMYTSDSPLCVMANLAEMVQILTEEVCYHVHVVDEWVLSDECLKRRCGDEHQ